MTSEKAKWKYHQSMSALLHLRQSMIVSAFDRILVRPDSKINFKINAVI